MIANGTKAMKKKKLTIFCLPKELLYFVQSFVLDAMKNENKMNTFYSMNEQEFIIKMANLCSTSLAKRRINHFLRRPDRTATIKAHK